jgi:hypothetical protein
MVFAKSCARLNEPIVYLNRVSLTKTNGTDTFSDWAYNESKFPKWSAGNGMNFKATFSFDTRLSKFTMTLSNTRSKFGPKGNPRYYYKSLFDREGYNQRFYLTGVDSCTRRSTIEATSR